MTYLNFFKITPPAPNDPKVNELTQLNNNWDYLDTRLQLLSDPNTVIPTAQLDQGQELVRDEQLQVWTGSAIRTADNVRQAWTAWTAYNIQSPVTTRAGYAPKWRRNTMLNMIEVTGEFFHNAGGGWPNGFVPLNTDTASNSIPKIYAPAGSKITCMPGAAGTPSIGTGGAAALIRVIEGTNATILQCRYRGQPFTPGSNFVNISNVRWIHG